MAQLERYGALVRYDQQEGRLWLLDATQLPANVVRPVEDVADAVAPIAALHAVEPRAGALAAAYGIALTARNWQGRPTDARRGVLIQSAQRLLPAPGAFGAALLAETTSRADQALLAGDDPEQVLVRWLNERVRQLDRATERCGRHAAGLLVAGEQLALAGGDSLPLQALLEALDDETRKTIAIHALGNMPLLAAKLQLADSEATPALCLAVVDAVARDGSALCARGVGANIVQMRQLGVPCYLLAPGGPVAAIETAQAFDVSAADVIAPHLISAIVTDRGLYRPEMISRYLDDGDAPLDVIPLLG